jgi:uncharacterized membrane protein
MLPIIGHGAIPTGIALGLSAWGSFLLCELGFIVPAVAIYGIGDAVLAWKERRQGWIKRTVDAVLRHTHARVGNEVGTAGLIGLAAFVALPIPGTGVWTGTLGAFLLRIPFRTAAPYILAGNIAQGIIMMLATTGTVAAFRAFL